MTAKNANSILKTDFVDGVLVGGASLMAEEELQKYVILNLRIIYDLYNFNGFNSSFINSNNFSY